MNINSKKSFHQNVHYALIVLYAISIPFAAKFNSLLVILIVINWAAELNFQERFINIWRNKTIFILISYYLLCLVGLIYTNNYEVGFGILIKRITLILFPIFFANYYYSEKILKWIYFSFVLIIILIVTYTLINVYVDHKMHLLEYSSDQLREFLIKPLKLHPPYFALYVLFAICLLNYLLLNNKYLKKIHVFFFGILINIYLVGFSILLASRMALIALVIILMFASTFIVLKKKFYLLFFSVILLIIFFSYFIISSTLYSQRFYEIVETKWEPPIGIHHNSTNLRIGIFKCTYEGFKQNWLLGSGTGDMQDQLNACYIANGYSDVMYKDNYNTHSIYLDALLMLGIVGLLVLLSNIAIYLRIAIQNQAWIYLCFLFVFLFCGITESFLNTQKGVVFFSYFNTLLFFNYKKKDVFQN